MNDETLPTAAECRARIEELESARVLYNRVVDERIQTLRDVEHSILESRPEPESVMEVLDSLPWEVSRYGGEWVKASEVPPNIVKVFEQREGKLVTSDFSYYLSKRGNLQRYKPKEATA